LLVVASRAGVATFDVLPCCSGSAKGNMTMKVIATHFFQAAWLWLHRNPVLTVLMVYSLVFSIAALTVTYIVFRINYSCPTVHGHGLLYLVQAAVLVGS
jgi:hypothetical protein